MLLLSAGESITTAERSGSGRWKPSLSVGPDTSGSSSFLQGGQRRAGLTLKGMCEGDALRERMEGVGGMGLGLCLCAHTFGRFRHGRVKAVHVIAAVAVVAEEQLVLWMRRGLARCLPRTHLD